MVVVRRVKSGQYITCPSDPTLPVRPDIHHAVHCELPTVGSQILINFIFPVRPRPALLPGLLYVDGASRDRPRPRPRPPDRGGQPCPHCPRPRQAGSSEGLHLHQHPQQRRGQAGQEALTQ